MLKTTLIMTALLFSIVSDSFIFREEAKIEIGDRVSFVLLVSNSNEKNCFWLPAENSLKTDFSASKTIENQQYFCIRYLSTAEEVSTVSKGTISEVFPASKICERISELLLIKESKNANRILFQASAKKGVFLSAVEKGDFVESGQVVGRICSSAQVKHFFRVLDESGPVDRGLHIGFRSSDYQTIFEIVSEAKGGSLGIVRNGKIIGITKIIDGEMGTLLPVFESGDTVVTGPVGAKKSPE